LLLQDVVATFALVLLAAGRGGSITAGSLLFLATKGAILSLGLIFVSSKVLPRMSKVIAGSQEFLFLFAIAWGFGIATLFEVSGFSIEVGALFAGVSLASLPYSQEIAARLKPLRDFFVVVFFIALGEGLQLSNIGNALVPAIALSLLVIVLKPFLVLVSMGMLGYTKRTSFKTAISLSQISEFSLVFVVLATGLGFVPPEISTIITLVAIITIAVSTYLMHYDDQLFVRLENHLRLFERKVVKDEKKISLGYPLVLFGYHKGGHEFVKTFREMHKRFVVVDYNPEVVEQLEHQSIHYIYGDATDLELLEEIGIERAKLVVSIITDFATNESLAIHLNKVNPKVIFVCHAETYDQAAALYRIGVTYVMMPHLIGSERISNFIKRNGTSQHAFDNYRQKHMLSLGRLALQ
ncbi:MAG: cation:proton antiporter, partial [Microcoleus sp.]